MYQKWDVLEDDVYKSLREIPQRKLLQVCGDTSEVEECGLYIYPKYRMLLCNDRILPRAYALPKIHKHLDNFCN